MLKYISYGPPRSEVGSVPKKTGCGSETSKISVPEPNRNLRSNIFKTGTGIGTHISKESFFQLFWTLTHNGIKKK